MSNALEGLTQEQMIELANKVNAATPDATVDDAENAARQAAAAAKAGEPQGSQSAADLAAEAAKFVAEKEPDAEEVLGEKPATVAEGGEKPDTAAEPETATEFPTSDDPSLNAALGLMKAAGMTSEQLTEHFGEAINTGDVSKVDRAALERVLGSDKTELVMAGVTKWSAEAGAAALEAARQVQAAVGGADNWAKMTAWAKAAAAKDPAVKSQIEDITDLLNGNATARKLGAAEFQRLYNADPKNATVGTSKPLNGDKPAAAEKVKPMTGREAYEAKEKLHRQRQLGKVSVSEFNAGLRKIAAARAAAK